MNLAVVFDPDPSLGTDPLDSKNQPRRLGEWWDSSKVDVFLVVREFGEQFDDGARTHVYSSGAWENIQSKAIKKILGKLGDL